MTTALSPSLPDPEVGDDRRIGLRALSILRVARAVWDGADQLCVIRNISSGGVMFECLHPPALDTEVLVELRSDRRMTGLVRWVRDGRAGIQFADEIDVAHMLREDRSSLLRIRARLPRFVRRGIIRLIVEGETIPADIADISITGVRCRPEAPVRAGAPLVAALDGVGAANAVVRWARGDSVGVGFEKPLSWKPFQLWLDQAPRA